MALQQIFLLFLSPTIDFLVSALYLYNMLNDKAQSSMKKQVMTTAHQLTKESMSRKEFGSRSYRYVFSQCLVRAWRAEKEAQKKKKAVGVLFGSPKQIAWASDIKQQSIERMNIKIERMKAKGRAQIVAAYTEIKKRVETETSASWFINELASYERQVRKLYNI